MRSSAGALTVYTPRPGRRSRTQGSKLAADAFEFFDEVGDFGEDAVFFGEVLRVEGAHFREYRVEFGAIVAGKFALERDGKVALGEFWVEVFGFDERCRFVLLPLLGELEEGIDDAGGVGELIEVGLVDEVDHQAFFGAIVDAGANHAANAVDERGLVLGLFVVGEDLRQDVIEVNLQRFQ